VAAAASLVVALGAAFVGGVSVGRAHRIDPSAVDQAIAAVQAHGNAPPSTADLEADAVRGVVGGLDDTWAAYYGVGSDPASQTQLRALLDGEYSGLGLWLRRSGTERGGRTRCLDPECRRGRVVADRAHWVDGAGAGAHTGGV
jgi:hypothetical protein